GGGLSGGEVEQLGARVERGGLRPVAVAADEDPVAGGAELAGAVLDLVRALAQQPRWLGADEVEEVEVGDGEAVVAGVGHGDEGLLAGAVRGPGLEASGRHGD